MEFKKSQTVLRTETTLNENSMKSIKDYLHLYLGCEVQYPDPNGKMITAKFTGFSRTDGVETTYKKKPKAGEAVGDYLSWEANGYHNANALHLKPILRPLSSMTEEECYEASVISGKRRVYMPRYWAGEGSARYMYMTPEQCFKLTHYLLSRSFDLFDLIHSGLAIDGSLTPIKH
jgi:hypothetical protein